MQQKKTVHPAELIVSCRVRVCAVFVDLLSCMSVFVHVLMICLLLDKISLNTNHQRLPWTTVWPPRGRLVSWRLQTQAVVYTTPTPGKGPSPRQGIFTLASDAWSSSTTGAGSWPLVEDMLHGIHMRERGSVQVSLLVRLKPHPASSCGSLSASSPVRGPPTIGDR